MLALAGRSSIYFARDLEWLLRLLCFGHATNVIKSMTIDEEKTFLRHFHFRAV